MKQLVLLALGLAVLPLTACSNSAEQQMIENQIKNPPVEQVGTFDGCTVSYVNRYYKEYSFYLAKCGNTTTATGHYTERQGKAQVTRTRTTILQDLKDAQKALDAFDEREAALAKLTPQDRDALGLRESKDVPAPKQ